MEIIQIIEKKRKGLALSKEEINFWIAGVMDESIADYQTSALLMAIVLNGMTIEETSNLTMAMLNSGDTIDLSSIVGIKVDKHSTGGVGDKATLVLGPIVAACNAKVAKMSGRGLGHTGGTLDKLEAIKGYQIDISEEDFIKQVNEIGIALIGQTGHVVPADKKLYALRDVTATVDSLPLIAASIMSKKLASGSDTILLDVKYGDGAFMETKEDAENLAKVMIEIGNYLNKNTKAMITSMNQPLGYAVGNSLEVIEAIETLKGRGPKDLVKLTYTSSAIMLQQANLVDSFEAGLELVEKSIKDLSALEKFRQLIKAQHGLSDVIDDYTLFDQAKYTLEIKSELSGYVKNIASHDIGVLAMNLGAGRKVYTDTIDHSVGIVLNKKVSDFVEKGDVLATIYYNQPLAEDFNEKCLDSFIITDKISEVEPIIYKVL